MRMEPFGWPGLPRALPRVVVDWAVHPLARLPCGVGRLDHEHSVDAEFCTVQPTRVRCLSRAPDPVSGVRVWGAARAALLGVELPQLVRETHTHTHTHTAIRSPWTYSPLVRRSQPLSRLDQHS
jgi:hypothetical protein